MGAAIQQTAGISFVLGDAGRAGLETGIECVSRKNLAM
jgi:hypothetical protein